MDISALTLFPELYKPFFSTSLIKRAQESKLIRCETVNLFEYTALKERIDAPTYGHGSGMLIRPDVIGQAIETQEERKGPAYKIFFSPQGKKLDQDLLKKIYSSLQEQAKNHLLLFSSRYEGIDARVESYYADVVVSLGDFVLMGGDIAALAFLEGFLRLLPGVVGKQESVEHESFSGPFVDYPEYTAPLVWKGMEVPEVVRSGNHKALQEWREKEAALRSVLFHFQWVKTHELTAAQAALVRDYIPSHYVILMHTQVLLPGNLEGTTSVTSIDIHDIARSAKTYGIKNYFVVTPLKDQQRIVRTLLDFWSSSEGIEYNPHRHGALELVVLVSSLEEAIAYIKDTEKRDPLLVGTSAKKSDTQHGKHITYYDQEKVWSNNKPIAFLFGTGKGLAPSVLEQCAFMLPPLASFSPFNHLSVRSAASVVLDRWLGNNIKNFSRIN
jgi:tRNA (guanine37-N1)-methyltransferase